VLLVVGLLLAWPAGARAGFIQAFSGNTALANVFPDPGHSAKNKVEDGTINFAVLKRPTGMTWAGVLGLNPV
jgi:hypothetical protein